MTFPVPDVITPARADLRVALAQVAFHRGGPALDPREANLTRAREAIKEASNRSANVVVFGELFLSGPDAGPWAERYAVTADLTEPHVAEVSTMAREFDLTIVMGCLERARHLGDVHNSALVATPDGAIRAVRKTHLATFPYRHGVSNEHANYSPGHRLGVTDTPAGRIGLHICYDIFFPEVARTQALLGADYLLNVAAAGEGFESYWDHLTWARATENGSWYLLCSVVGDTDARAYFGGTRAIAPDGEVVARAKDRSEEVLMVDVDLSRSRRFRSQLHLFANRQPALYEPITRDQRYEVESGRAP